MLSTIFYLFILWNQVHSIGGHLQALPDPLTLNAATFKLMDTFFSWVVIVEVYDLVEEETVEEDIPIDFLRGAFEKCEIILLYNRIIISSLASNNSEPDFEIPAEINSTTNVRLNSEYGIGWVLITQSIDVLAEYVSSNTSKHRVSDNNIFIIVTSSCTYTTMKHSEHFVKNSWYSNFVSHLILLLYKCSRLVFFDVIENKVTWININDTQQTQDLITFNTANYMQYPIRITIFKRFPTVIPRDEVTELPLPEYITDLYDKVGGLTGIDAICLAVLGERLNFKPTLYVLNGSVYGDVRPNGQFTGTLGDIIYNHTDIAMNGRYIKGYGADDKIEFLSYIGFDKICIVTPKALIVPRWKTLLLIFEATTWIGLGVLVAISSVLWFALKKYKTRPDIKHQSFVQCVIDVALLLVSQPLHIATTLREREKLIALPFLFASFYISGVFQAMLTSLTSTQNYQKDINTLKELDESNYLITFSSSTYTDLFGENPIGTIKSLANKLRIQDRSLPSMTYPAFHRNSSTIERDGDARFIIQSLYSDPSGKPLLHVMSQCPRVYFLSAIIRKGWPFRSDFNRMLNRFKEFGLIDKWYEDIRNAIISHQKVKAVKRGIVDDGGPEAYTLLQLISPFYILGIGLSLGIVAFIFELVLSKSKKRNY